MCHDTFLSHVSEPIIFLGRALFSFGVGEAAEAKGTKLLELIFEIRYVGILKCWGIKIPTETVLSL